MNKRIRFNLIISQLGCLKNSFAVMGTIGDRFITSLININSGIQIIDVGQSTFLQVALIDGSTNILLDTISLEGIDEITYDARIQISYTVNNSIQQEGLNPCCNNSSFCDENRYPRNSGYYSVLNGHKCKKNKCRKKFNY